jgi:hypothetical protein
VTDNGKEMEKEKYRFGIVNTGQVKGENAKRGFGYTAFVPTKVE